MIPVANADGQGRTWQVVLMRKYTLCFQELCVKLPQAMGGATWLMRLEAGLVLFASLVHADGAR